MSTRVGTNSQPSILVELLAKQIDTCASSPTPKRTPPRTVVAKDGVTLVVEPVPLPGRLDFEMAGGALEAVRGLVVGNRESRGFEGLVRCAGIVMGIVRVELHVEGTKMRGMRR